MKKLLDILFPDAAEEVGIILIGDFNSPSIEHMQFIKDILENWEEFLDSVDKIMDKTAPVKWGNKNSNWKKRYYLDTIFPSDNLNISFEFCFSPHDRNKIGGMIVEIEDGKMTKVLLS